MKQGSRSFQAEDSSSKTTCLSYEEAGRLLIGSKLPKNRLLHLENCEDCEAFVHEVKNPPDMSGFLVQLLGARSNISSIYDQEEPVAIDRFWSAHTAVMFLAIILSVGGILGVSAFIFDVVRGHQVEELSRAHHATEVVEADLVFLRRSRDTERGALTAELSRHEVKSWTNAAIRAWVLSQRQNTDEEVAHIFDRCRKERIYQGIPKAILYAKLSAAPGRVHVMAAREFLSDFDDQEIESFVKLFAPLTDKEAVEFLNMFEKFKDRIRDA